MSYSVSCILYFVFQIWLGYMSYSVFCISKLTWAHVIFCILYFWFKLDISHILYSVFQIWLGYMSYSVFDPAGALSQQLVELSPIKSCKFCRKVKKRHIHNFHPEKVGWIWHDECNEWVTWTKKYFSSAKFKISKLGNNFFGGVYVLSNLSFVNCSSIYL